MIIKYTDKNKYGGYTWEIALDSLFKIQVHETNNSSFVVDLKEWKWFNSKILLSFISNDNMEETIKYSFDKVYEFLQNQNDFIWSNLQKESKKKEVLNEWYNITGSSPSKNSLCKSEWNTFLAEVDVPSEFKEVIDTFFIPDSIILSRYANNNMILNSISKNGYPRYGIIPDEVIGTEIFEEYFAKKYSYKPMGTPDWFVCAYPDVSIWFQKNYANLEKDFSNDNGKYFEHRDVREETHPKALRWMIDRYVLEGGSLECSL